MSEITWAELTEFEQGHLKSFNNDPHAVSARRSSQSLETKGLIKWGWETGYALTDLGRAVLAQADAKPTTITAAEFVANGYAAKIAARECVVNHHFPMDLFKVTDVYEMPFRSKVTGTNLRIEYVDIDDDPCDILPDEQLTVTWLAQTDAKPDSGARVGGNAQVEADQGIHAMCIAERERNEALEKDFATVRDLLLGIKKEAEWVATNKGLDIEASPIYQWTKQILALSSPGKIIVDEIEQLRAELANAKAEAGRLRAAATRAYNCLDAVYETLDGDFGNGLSHSIPRVCEEIKAALQAGTEGG